MITPRQKEMCIDLYLGGNLTIKQILNITGIRSEQTVYRILDDAKIPRLEKGRNTVKKITVSIDQDTADLLDIINPDNRSEFICKCIQGYCSVSPSRKEEIENAILERCTFYKGEEENPFDKEKEEYKWFMWDRERASVEVSTDPLYLYKYGMRSEDDYDEYFQDLMLGYMDLYLYTHNKEAYEEWEKQYYGK